MIIVVRKLLKVSANIILFEVALIREEFEGRAQLTRRRKARNIVATPMLYVRFRSDVTTKFCLGFYTDIGQCTDNKNSFLLSRLTENIMATKA